MTRKVSAMTAITGVNVDSTADYVPIVDASVADASKNKRILIDELKTALGVQCRPPTTSLFNFTANTSGATQSSTYNASIGLSFARTDAGTAGNRISFLGKTVPASGGWTATAKVKFGAQLVSQTVKGGMALYNSGSGKLLSLGLVEFSGGTYFVSESFSSLSDGGSTVISNQINSLSNAPIWFQIVESSTLYTLNYSFDEGITWVAYTTAAKATYFTADYVGVFLYSGTAVTIRPTLLVGYYSDPDFP